jgi:hypothetical protein
LAELGIVVFVVFHTAAHLVVVLVAFHMSAVFLFEYFQDGVSEVVCFEHVVVVAGVVVVVGPQILTSGQPDTLPHCEPTSLFWLGHDEVFFLTQTHTKLEIFKEEDCRHMEGN